MRDMSQAFSELKDAAEKTIEAKQNNSPNTRNLQNNLNLFFKNLNEEETDLLHEECKKELTNDINYINSDIAEVEIPRVRKEIALDTICVSLIEKKLESFGRTK